jgi:hypothetical protein
VLTFTTLPAPPGDTGTIPTGNPQSATCPAVGTCFVIGSAYDAHPEGSIVTWANSTWSAIRAPLPPDNTVDSSNFHVQLSQIACGGASSCAVIGTYASTTSPAADGREGLLLTDTNGTWTAERAPVPSDHVSTNDEAYLNSVSCDAPGSCIAVGTYLHYINGGPAWNESVLVERLSGGVWTPSALPLPADVGSSIQSDLSAVSCGGPGSCTAVGYYYRANPATSTGMQEWPLVETFTNGAATATAAPLPNDASTTNFFGDYLQNVGCSGTGCAAYGDYKDSNGVLQWVLESASNGGWTPTNPGTSPSTSSASGLSDVSCGGPSDCVIVGENTDSSNRLYAVMESLHNGAWSGGPAALPSDTNTTQPYSFLRAASCQDATDCAAVGQYASQSSGSGLIDMLGAGVWTGYASSPGYVPYFVSVACDPSGTCIAPGANGAVFLINAPPPPPPPPVTITTTSLANGVVRVSYAAQLSASGGVPGPDTYSLVSGSLPAGLSLSSSGAISGTPTAAGTSTFTVQAADSASPSDTGTATLSLTVVPVEVTPTTMPNAPIDAAYKKTLGAIGGTAPYTWKLLSGTLPKGLTMASTGVVSGTPTVLGTSTFKVQVTDSTSPTHGTATAFVSLTVVPMAVATTSLPNAPVGRAYKATLTTRGGKAVFHWKITSGALPAGLSMTTGGVISGTPSTVGTSSFTVKVTDSEVPAETATANESITVTPMAITTSSLPDGTAHHAYSAKLTVSGGKGTLTFSRTAGALPPGIIMSAAGVFSGTPTTPGTYGFTISVHDSSTPKNSATWSYTITVH